jgi:hypothetical protein
LSDRLGIRHLVSAVSALLIVPIKEVRMKKQMCVLMFIVAISLTASAALSDTPTVTVYFDEALTAQSTDFLKPGLNTIYVVAEGFDAKLTAIEYKIDYPAGMTWVEDHDVSPLKIGTTEKGISQAWATPIDGSGPVVVAKVLIRWNPKLGSDADITVSPHPMFGYIRATAAPDHRIIEAKGGDTYGRSDDRYSSYSGTPALRDVYPNPFNPVTKITYWIPEKAHVNLSIYDVAGRLVERLVDDVRERGEYTIEWQAGGLSSGVYFCLFEVGDFSENRKVMLLK